jgi:hypothetical protein
LRRIRPWLSFGALASGVVWIAFRGEGDPESGSAPLASRGEAVGYPVPARSSDARTEASVDGDAESQAVASRADAQEMLDRWKLEPVSALLGRIRRYHGHPDGENLETALMALSFALKHTTNTGDAALVGAVVRDPREPLPLRLELLHPMILAGTTTAFVQILDIYHVSEEPAVRNAVLHLFPQMQSEYRISREREDLTPGLITAFTAEPDTSPLLGPLASLAASFGGEEGIAFLLNQVFSKPMSLEEIEGSDDPRLDASLRALRQVYRPEAVRPLAQLLAGYDPADPRIHLAGQLLARIADKTASEALVEYAAHAPAEFAGIVSTWLWQGNAKPAVLETLVARRSFDSSQVKQALQRTLEQGKPSVSGGGQASEASLKAPLANRE